MISEKTLNQVKKESKIIYYLIIAFISLIKNKQIRDIGKILAESNEYIQRDWINENTKLNVKKRDDSDNNGTGYDLISNDEVLTIQGKLRAKELHLENTRRKSKKNYNSSDTGHVAYSVGEADLYLFSRPNISNYENVDKWSFIAIPESELIDKNNPNYLVTRVPKTIWSKYLNNSIEVIEKEYVNKVKKTSLIG
jgi:hypothetical protein